MKKTIKIGILRETKNPPDRRVPLTPLQIDELKKLNANVEFYVQPSDFRCYSDDEYKYLKIPLKEDLGDCDILLGVKEVDPRTVIPEKTYLFFAHVGKKQPHNRAMLRAMTDRDVSLIDYEYLTLENGQRVVAFGRWAGIIGAYNAIRAIGISKSKFNLKPAHQCRDLDEMWECLKNIHLEPGLKMLITGGGRVANGALETLGVTNIVKVDPHEYLNRDFNFPVVCQIGPEHYVKSKSGKLFSFNHFVSNPEEYNSDFLQYTEVTDVLISGHYWDPRSPVLFTKEDIRRPEFRISIIADISCDINGSIPSTLRASTISDPYYGYNPELEIEEPAFLKPDNITVMSVDNLPGELPRDASQDFGRQLMKHVLHDLFYDPESRLLMRATILKRGKLTTSFAFLEDYLK